MAPVNYEKAPRKHFECKSDPGEGFTCFPNILFDLSLDPDEAIVLLSLVRARRFFFDSGNAGAFPDCTVEQLSSLCFGLPAPSIRRILLRLHERGFINHCGSPGEIDPSLVILNFDEDGKETPANHFGFHDVQCGADDQAFYRGHDHFDKLVRLDRLDELGSMPYTEYLLTPEWKARRLVEIERAGGRCELCNDAGPFHVHHRTYERRGNEAPGDLLVLCAPCHKSFHDHRTLA